MFYTTYNQVVVRAGEGFVILLYNNHHEKENRLGLSGSNSGLGCLCFTLC